MLINCIILGAGFSRRMGENKLLLPFNGKPLLEWTLGILNAKVFQKIILVTTNEIAQRICLPPFVETIINQQPEKGQSRSIHLGLQHGPKADGNMFFVGDQPFLTQNDIALLIAAFQKHPNKIIVPLYGQKKGSPTIFPNAMNPLLMNLSGDIGGRDIIATHPQDVYYVSMPCKNAGIDIDTKADYLTFLQPDNN